MLKRLWTAPADMAGMAVVRLAGARIHDVWQGALVARAPTWSLTARLLARHRFQAITIGSVIICAAVPTPALLRHELEHVRQWERWGCAFPGAYAAGWLVGLWRWLRERDGGVWWREAYRRNPFEVAAREAAR